MSSSRKRPDLGESQQPRPLLVGELNPFGGDEYFALYPLPPECSGGRLQRILGLSRTEYLRIFDRANLCRGAWSLAQARARASALLAVERSALVLLGAKVCQAFRVEFRPFTVAAVGDLRAAILPHPSGRNLTWNEPSAAQRARQTLVEAGISLSATLLTLTLDTLT